MKYSFFEASAHKTVYPCVNGHTEVDYAVIGSSLTACLTAFYICVAGREVALISDCYCGEEAEFLYGGITPQNFARECSEDYNKAIEGLEKTITENNFDADYEKKGFFYFSDRPSSLKKLVRYCRDAQPNSAFLPPEKACEKFTFDVVGGVYQQNAAVLSPVKLAKAVAAKTTLHGGAVYENSPISDITQNPRGYLIKTSDGEILASNVADCRETLFDKNEYSKNAFIVCAFEAADTDGWFEKCCLADCYRYPLSFCVIGGKVVARAKIPRFLSLSPFYYNYKLLWIRDIFNEMFFTRKIYPPCVAFVTEQKEPKNQAFIIKETDDKFLSSLCSYENSVIAAEMAAREFTKMFKIFT